MDSLDPVLLEAIKVIVRQELDKAGLGVQALTKVRAADRLGISVRTLDREISAGHINTVRVRDSQKITLTEIAAYLERNGKRQAA